MITTIEQTNVKTPSLAAARQYIYAIDFTKIIDKMVRFDDWTIKDAELTCKMYRNLLYLKKKHEGTGIKTPPSIDIDEFWHNHILDTQKYRNDCQAIFGYFLHHYPTYPGSSYKKEMSRLDDNFTKLQTLYFQEFGEHIVNTRERRSPLLNKLICRVSRLFKNT